MATKLVKRVEVDDETFVEAMKIFEVPTQFYYTAARKMLTNEEVVLITKMGTELISPEALAKIVIDNNLADNAEEFILNSWRKSVISKVEEVEGSGEFNYQITSFYGMISSFAQFHANIYSTFTKPVIDAISQWVHETALGIHRKTILNRMNGIGFENRYLQSDFLSLDEALQALEDSPSDTIYHLRPCDCKAITYYHHKPTNVCLNIGPRTTAINSAYSKGLGKVLSRDEARELIIQCDKDGLMHCGEHDGFCNCDAVACFPVRRGVEIGAQGIYPQSHYKIEWHTDKCINCGKCTRICNFGAFYMDAYEDVQFDRSKCYGCTICSSNCPKKAIELIPTGERPIPGFLKK